MPLQIANRKVQIIIASIKKFSSLKVDKYSLKNMKITVNRRQKIKEIYLC